jgi:hypothetical protein
MEGNGAPARRSFQRRALFLTDREVWYRPRAEPELPRQPLAFAVVTKIEASTPPARVPAA